MSLTFYPVTYASVYNLQFQYLLYRPLSIFGNNTSSSVAINYPLSPANPPTYSNGGKTVTVTMKGWKWSNGEPVDAQSLIFFLNMTEAEQADWYGYSAGLLPDNLVSYKAIGTNQVQFQLNKAYSTIWFTYNQLGELKPMPESWDVTSLTGKPGSGGCTTDSAADGWARCKAVFTFLTAQSKIANTATHTNSAMSAFDQYATYGAQQLPFIWNPDEYTVQAVSSTLHNVAFSPLFTLLPEYWYFTK